MLPASSTERATCAPYQALEIPAAVSNSPSSHFRWVVGLREDAQLSRVSSLREPLWGPADTDQGDPPRPAVNAALPARDLFLDVISDDGTPLSRPAARGEGGETPAPLVAQPRGTALLDVDGFAVIDIEAASLPLSSDFGGAFRLVAVFQGRRAVISTPLVVTAGTDTASSARAEPLPVPRDGFAGMVHVGMSLVHGLRKRLRAQGRTLGPSMGGGPRGAAPEGGSSGASSSSAGAGAAGIGSGHSAGPSAAGQHPNPSHTAVEHPNSGQVGFSPRMIENSDSVVEALDWITAAVKVAVAKRAAEVMAMSSIMDFGGAETASSAVAPPAASPASPSTVDARALREGFGVGQASSAAGQGHGSHATLAGETARAPQLQASHTADPVRADSSVVVAKARTPSPASQWQVMLQGPASQPQGRSSPSPAGHDAGSPDSPASKPSAGSSWRPDTTPNPALAPRGTTYPIVPPQAVAMPPPAGVGATDRDQAFLAGAVSSTGSLPHDRSSLQAGWVRGHAAHTPSPQPATTSASATFQARSSGDSSFEDYPSSPDSSSYWHRLSSRDYVSTTVAALIQALGFERFKTGNLGRDLALVYLHLKPTAQARTGARLAGPRVLSTSIPRAESPSSPAAGAGTSFTGDAPPSLSAEAPAVSSSSAGQPGSEEASEPRVLIKLASVGKHKLESEAAKRLRARLINGSVDLSDPTVMTHKSGAAKRRRSALRALITSVLAAAFACGVIDSSVLSAPAVRRASNSTRRRSATGSSGDYSEFDSDRESSSRAKQASGAAEPHHHLLHRSAPSSHTGQMQAPPGAMPTMPGAVQVIYANDPRLSAGGPWGTAFVVDPFMHFTHGMVAGGGHPDSMYQDHYPQHGMTGPGGDGAPMQHPYVAVPQRALASHTGAEAMLPSSSAASSMRRDVSEMQAVEAQAIAEQQAAELEACRGGGEEHKIEALDRSTSAAYAAAEATRQAAFEESADAAARALPLHNDFELDRSPPSWRDSDERGRSKTPVGIGLPSRTASKQSGSDFLDRRRGSDGHDESAFRSHRRTLPGAAGPGIPRPPAFLGTAIDHYRDEDRLASQMRMQRHRQAESNLQFRGASALPPQQSSEHFASSYGLGIHGAAMPSVVVHPRGVPMQHLAAQLAGHMQGDSYGYPAQHVMGARQQPQHHHQPQQHHQPQPFALQFRGARPAPQQVQHSASAPSAHVPHSAPMPSSMAWYAHPSEMAHRHPGAMMAHPHMPSAMPPPSSYPESSHYAAGARDMYRGHASAPAASAVSSSTGIRAPGMDLPWGRPSIAPPSIYHTTLPQPGSNSSDHH